MVQPQTIPEPVDPAQDEFDSPDAPWNAEPEVRETMVVSALHAQRLDKAVVALAD